MSGAEAVSTIQSHGCLLACDPVLKQVRRWSENTGDFLELANRELGGAELNEVVGDEVAHRMRNALTRATYARRPALLFQCALPHRPTLFDVCIHSTDRAAIVEFERAGAPDSKPLEFTRELVQRIQSARSLEELLQTMPKFLRALLGYERATIYKFSGEAGCKVVAEAKSPDLESLMGLRLPSDHVLCRSGDAHLKCSISIIRDADDPGALIGPDFADAAASLDLARAHLSCPSRESVEHLGELGASSSLSLAVAVDGALWGLIVCRHGEPRALSLAERIAAEAVANVFALRIEAFERSAMLEAATLARGKLNGLLQAAAPETDIGAFLFEHLDSLAELVPSDGVGVYIAGEWRASGATAPGKDIARLASAVATLGASRVWSTQALSSVLPWSARFANEATGLLSAPLSEPPSDYLFFFRRAQPEPTGRQIPQSEPWSDADLQTAETARAQLLDIMMRHSEILAEQRRASDIRQKTLNDELNHRVKNMLALIKSLVSQDVGSASDVPSFADALKGRILALSNAHDQVVRSDGGGLLSALIFAEIGPYRAASREIEIRGPELALDSRAFSVLALVLHELTTNAAKYGSLSNDTGRLEISWSLEANGDCRLRWREVGGPPVKPPARSGFGAALIRRSVPFDLGGEAEVRFLTDGVEVDLLVPASYVENRPGGRKPPVAPQPAPDRAERALAGKRVLLVEDQFVIALEAEGILRDSGAGKVDLAATASEAARAISAAKPDLAVLDVNLGATTSLPIADRLADLGVPFVFATGYGDGSTISDRHRGAPVVRKPYGPEELIAGIALALRA